MKKIFTFLRQFNKKNTSNTEENNQSMFVGRQILMIKIAFWLGGSTHLLYAVKYLLADTRGLSYDVLSLLFSCLPSYYFLKKNNLPYASFFAYYPIIFLGTLSSYQEASTNLNAELGLIAYTCIPVICYKLPYNIIGIIVNYLSFIFIKIIKYPLHSITTNDFYNEIIMGTFIYMAIFIVAYLFDLDYKVLNKNIQELNLQKQIIETQAEELKIINSTKNRLFSVIAHDLRSPLSSLKGVMELIDNEQVSKEEFKELSKRLQSNVENVHGMLDNLLLWSLSQMEAIRPKLAPFDLDFMINETMLIFKESSLQKQIDLTHNSTVNLPALGDEYQIETVLRNVLNNAIKFTPSQGKIAIDSSIKGQFVNLKITDSGLGIEKNDLATIFSNPTLKIGTAGEKGTGFGLFLCKELIEKNGGTIEIDSEIGKGTTIDIMLPLMMN